ncbi:C-type lectin domain family 2 member B-like isoform X2 [Aythya fuligula]|uniref:C-type lectin domain family 2 member B-like isoform X2 n=1 Tax=Aythya fuligula TaxID=219594 RepID=A0A6J3EI98_AYTFU|nr:C-type lectin domain family 2 member B-like isoform X2 [Aythya fuligula]
MGKGDCENTHPEEEEELNPPRDEENLHKYAPMPSDVLSTPGAVNTMVQDEQSGLTSQYEDPDQPQDPQDTAATSSVAKSTDAAPTDRNRTQRCLGRVCTTQRQRDVLLILTLMLILSMVVLIATRKQQETAPVLACPYKWVGYRNVCYYLSGQQEQGNWSWSQEQCSRHGASLVVVKKDWELKFLRQFKDSGDSWLGLRRRGEQLRWVDGSSFNLTFPVQGVAECVYLNGEDVATSSCWQSRPYICSKPQAVGAAPEKDGGERTFSMLDTGSSSH